MIDLDSFEIIIGNLDLSIMMTSNAGGYAKLKGFNKAIALPDLLTAYEQNKEYFFET